MREDEAIRRRVLSRTINRNRPDGTLKQVIKNQAIKNILSTLLGYPTYDRRLAVSDRSCVLATVNPAPTGKIVISSPGFKGSRDGYQNKYKKVARWIQQLRIAAFIRYEIVWLTDNMMDSYENEICQALRVVIDYALAEAEEICQTSDPEIYLAGFSAGASASAVVSPEYNQVKGLLLIAPTIDAGREKLKEALPTYQGDLYITVGDLDYISEMTPEMMIQLSTSAQKIRLVEVANCDHQWTGKTNGRILSKSFIWAFNDDETYPCPEGGVELY